MGFKCSLLALSPSVPRDDISRDAEGGVDAAIAEVERLWPGAWRYAESGTLDEAFQPDHRSLWAGTWGTTTVVTHLDLPQPKSSTGRGRWELVIHSVVDLCHYATPPAYQSRDVTVSAEDDGDALAAALRGALLPFEEPYAAGRHSLDETPYHPLDLGESALLWIFGTIGEGAPDDEVSTALTPVEPWELPMHRFEPAQAPAANRSWLSRIFGR